MDGKSDENWLKTISTSKTNWSNLSSQTPRFSSKPKPTKITPMKIDVIESTTKKIQGCSCLKKNKPAENNEKKNRNL